MLWRLHTPELRTDGLEGGLEATKAFLLAGSRSVLREQRAALRRILSAQMETSTRAHERAVRGGSHDGDAASGAGVAVREAYAILQLGS